MACDLNHLLVLLSLMPGPLFLRTHGDENLVGVRSSYQLGLLGAGGETVQAGPPSHRCTGPSGCLCEAHIYHGLKLWPCPLNDQKSHLCFLFCQMGNPADTTPISKSTSSLAPGSLPRLGHAVSAGFRPQGSPRYCHSPEVNVCLKSQGRQSPEEAIYFSFLPGGEATPQLRQTEVSSPGNLF